MSAHVASKSKMPRYFARLLAMWRRPSRNAHCEEMTRSPGFDAGYNIPSAADDWFVDVLLVLKFVGPARSTSTRHGRPASNRNKSHPLR